MAPGEHYGAESEAVAAARVDGKVPTGRVVGIIARAWRTRGYPGSLQTLNGRVARAGQGSVLFSPIDTRFPIVRILTGQVSLPLPPSPLELVLIVHPYRPGGFPCPSLPFDSTWVLVSYRPGVPSSHSPHLRFYFYCEVSPAWCTSLPPTLDFGLVMHHHRPGVPPSSLHPF